MSQRGREARREFVAGSIGGAASVVVGQPFDTVKVRVQASNTGQGAMQVLRKTIRNEGVRALWKGTVAVSWRINPGDVYLVNYILWLLMQPMVGVAFVNALVFSSKDAVLNVLVGARNCSRQDHATKRFACCAASTLFRCQKQRCIEPPAALGGVPVGQCGGARG